MILMETTEISVIPVLKSALQNAFRRCCTALHASEKGLSNELPPRLYQVSPGCRADGQHGLDAKAGQDVVVKQSHGGSGKQARSIIDGLGANVATLALAGDTDALHTHGNWLTNDCQKNLPHKNTPHTSTHL